MKLSFSGALRLALLASAFPLALCPVHFAVAGAVSEKKPEVVQRQETKNDADSGKEENESEKTPEELAAIEPALGPAVFGFSPLFVGVGGAAAAGGVAAAAAGGGGGSSSGDETVSAPAPNPPPPPPALPSESAAQKGLSTIKAFDAHGRGFTGSGIVIGVLDSGIHSTNSEFAGRIAGCYDAESNLEGCDNTSVQAHGTHVAGILGASKNNVGMMGVAYNALILNADIFEAGGYGVPWAKQADAVNWAIDHPVSPARVINNSYGVGPYNLPEHTQEAVDGTFHPVDSSLGSAYQAAINKNVIMVWAAGNDYADQPGLLSALPLFYPQWKEHWVAVTATNTAGTALASYANKCGDAAEFCIAAPGGDVDGSGGIYSTYPIEGAYASMAGTSMATPHVTGAVAVLLEKFGPGTPTNFQPDRVVDLMFATANKTGIFADTAVFGQGLLDLEKATRPDAPTLAFPTGGSFAAEGQLVSGSDIVFGGAFGDAGALALSGKLAGAHDQYGRVFMIDLGELSESRDASTDSKALLQAFGSENFETVRFTPRTHMRLSFSDPVRESGLALGEEPPVDRPLKSMSLTSVVAPGTSLSFHYGVRPGEKMGLASSGDFDGSLLGANEETINPYFDFAGATGFSAGVEAAPFALPLKFRSLAFFSEQTREDPFYGDAGGQPDAVNGVAGETAFKAGRATFALMTGVVEEEQNILGTTSSGGFDMDEQTPTFFAGPSMRYRLAGILHLFGSWQIGWTEAGAADNSLFSEFSTIRSESFTAGIAGRGGFRTGDHWGFFVHQPLRVTEAEATLTLAKGRGSDGAPVYSAGRVDLTPSGRELNIQSFYRSDITGNQSFSGGLMVRLQPGHVRDASPEGIGLIRYRREF